MSKKSLPSQHRKPYELQELLDMQPKIFSQFLWLYDQFSGLEEFLMTQTDMSKNSVPMMRNIEDDLLILDLEKDGAYKRRTGFLASDAKIYLNPVASDMIDRGYFDRAFVVPPEIMGSSPPNKFFRDMGDSYFMEATPTTHWSLQVIIADQDQLITLMNDIEKVQFMRTQDPIKEQNQPPAVREKMLKISYDAQNQCLTDNSGRKEPFSKENEKQSTLIRAAFLIQEGPDHEYGFGKWIDKLHPVITDSFPERKLYDTAKALNKRLSDKFGLSEDFFEAEFGNKRVKLNLKAKSFKIESN